MAFKITHALVHSQELDYKGAAVELHCREVRTPVWVNFFIRRAYAECVKLSKRF